mmetsp:Transcript_113473/g.321104  ORF Transcript_113473/g.321104 Transcript_113473/m.321104 type:complete len:236 (-) Transcript_113473:60-767(-)
MARSPQTSPPTAPPVRCRRAASGGVAAAGDRNQRRNAGGKAAALRSRVVRRGQEQGVRGTPRVARRATQAKIVAPTRAKAKARTRAAPSVEPDTSSSTSDKESETSSDDGTSSSASSTSSASSSAPRSAMGRNSASDGRVGTPFPEELGQHVAVVGDGWGGHATGCLSDVAGAGGYEAIVTEADELTFTVVALGSWEETHVLRSRCIPLRASGPLQRGCHTRPPPERVPVEPCGL